MTDWETIIAAVTLTLGGDRDSGRRDLMACWHATAETDHAERCVIAHYLADLQPDLADEVAWDERALAAYGHLSGDDLAAVGIPSTRGLAPSLHLNLGDGYLRQGRLERAREQLACGVAAQHALGEDGYGGLIRSGLAGLGERIARAAG